MSSTCPNLSGAGETRAPWLAHYPEFVPTSLEYPDQPLWWLLEESARNFPDRVACHYYEQQVTYRELFDSARRALDEVMQS